MSKYEFFMPMEPPHTTYQQHRVDIKRTKSGCKPIFYDTDEIKLARSKYIAHLAQHKPDQPLEGAVKLKVIFCFQASNIVGHRHGDFKITKPDTDNMLKLFKDCMTKVGFWHDDAQVAQEWTEKRYCDVQGVYVEVQEIKPNIKANESDYWDDV